MKPLKIRLGPWAFTPGLISSLSTVLLLPLFVYLGFWQLQRAEGKRMQQQHWENRIKAPVIVFNLDPHLREDAGRIYEDNINIEAIRYRRLHVSGQFLNEQQILLDNQIFKKRVGYRLFTPFLPTNSTKLILVDRGFIPIEKNRTELPILKPITEHILLVGMINVPAQGLRLHSKKEIPAIQSADKKNDSKTIHLITVQRVDFTELSDVLKRTLLPFVLQLTEDSPYHFQIPPLSFGLSETRHLGYAAQWFTIAFAALLYYLVTNTRRLKNETQSYKQPCNKHASPK